MAMPRTPPSGFLRGVSRAMATARATSSGTCARASCVAAWARNSCAARSCSNSLRCSARTPDKPGAPPRGASRRAEATLCGVKVTGSAGSCANTSGGIGARCSAGLRAGSVRAANVCSVPGANAGVVSACRARDTSPMRMFAHVLSRRRASASNSLDSGTASAARGARRAAPTKRSQSPRWKAAARPSSPNRNNFQARAAVPSPPCALRNLHNAGTSAPRTAARMKGGTSCKVGTGWRNSSCRSMEPNCAHAASLMAVCVWWPQRWQAAPFLCPTRLLRWPGRVAAVGTPP